MKTTFPRKVVLTTPPQRILIIKPSSLGDIATTLPLLCDLKALYPTAQIDWLIDPGFADLVRGHDALNSLLVFDRKRIGKWWTPSGMRNLLLLRHTLVLNRYDMVLDAQGLLRSALISTLTRARTRIGFSWAREGAVHFYTHLSYLPPPPQLAVVRMRSLMEPLGGSQRPAEFRIPVQQAATETIRRLLMGQHPRLATVIPGSRWNAKRWSEQGFLEIAKRLCGAGFTVLVLGSKDEHPIGDMICQNIGPGNMNLAGKTTLAEMIAALALSDIVVGNDSGPLHVAAALQRPLVGLYGPTDPLDVGPYGQLDHVLAFDKLGDYKASVASDRSLTLARLPVEEVWKMIKNVLGI